MSSSLNIINRPATVLLCVAVFALATLVPPADATYGGWGKSAHHLRGYKRNFGGWGRTGYGGGRYHGGDYYVRRGHYAGRGRGRDYGGWGRGGGYYDDYGYYGRRLLQDEKNGGERSQQTMLDIINSREDLSMLKDALADLPDMREALNKDASGEKGDPFFAPTNDAIRTLIEDAKQGLKEIFGEKKLKVRKRRTHNTHPPTHARVQSPAGGVNRYSVYLVVLQ